MKLSYLSIVLVILIEGVVLANGEVVYQDIVPLVQGGGEQVTVHRGVLAQGEWKMAVKGYDMPMISFEVSIDGDEVWAGTWGEVSYGDYVVLSSGDYATVFPVHVSVLAGNSSQVVVDLEGLPEDIFVQEIFFVKVSDQESRGRTTTAGGFGPHVSGRVWVEGEDLNGEVVNVTGRSVKNYQLVRSNKLEAGGTGGHVWGNNDYDNDYENTLGIGDCGAWRVNINLYRMVDGGPGELSCFKFIVGRNGAIRVLGNHVVPWQQADSDLVRNNLRDVVLDPTVNGPGVWRIQGGPQVITTEQARWLKSTILLILDSMEKDDVDWSSIIPRCPGSDLEYGDDLISVLKGNADSEGKEAGPTGSYDQGDIDSPFGRFDMSLPEDLGERDYPIKYILNIPGHPDTGFSINVVPLATSPHAHVRALSVMRGIIRAFLLVLVTYGFMRKTALAVKEIG